MEVKLGIEASEDLISSEAPEVVIVATGSMPAIPNIPGIENDNVITCVDLLLGKKQAGQKVAVIGGGLIGCETALWLAKQGKEVTIVEMLGELMAGSLPVPQMNRMMLLDLLALDKVNLITGARVREISEKGVIAVKDSNPVLIKADTVVLASGLKSDDGLYQALRGKVAELYATGDCQQPRNIMGAIWDGYEVGRAI